VSETRPKSWSKLIAEQQKSGPAPARPKHFFFFSGNGGKPVDLALQYKGGKRPFISDKSLQSGSRSLQTSMNDRGRYRQSRRGYASRLLTGSKEDRSRWFIPMPQV
jgi:hypothetical protein